MSIRVNFYPVDGNDFDLLIKKARNKINEYKESIFVSLDLEKKDFWSTINTLLSIMEIIKQTKLARF